MKYVNTGYGKIPFVSCCSQYSPYRLCGDLPGLAIYRPSWKTQRGVSGNVTEMEIQLLTVLPNLCHHSFLYYVPARYALRRIRWDSQSIGLRNLRSDRSAIFLRQVDDRADSAQLSARCGLRSCHSACGSKSHIPVFSSARAYASARHEIEPFQFFRLSLPYAFLRRLGGPLINWHLSFIVYMLPVVPLLLMRYMTADYIDSHKILLPPPPLEPRAEPDKPSDMMISKPACGSKPASPNFHFQGSVAVKLLIGVMALYLVKATYAAEGGF